MAFSGWIFMVVGALFFLDIMGVVLLVVGFFLATTSDGVSIDVGARRVRKFSGPFGLPMVGRWESLDNYAGLTVIPIQQKFTTWSRSNRQSTIERSDYRVFLVGLDRKPAFALKKNDSNEQAVIVMDKLALALRMTVWASNT